MKNILPALVLVCVFASCKTKHIVSNENKLELSQLNFKTATLERKDFDIQQVASVEKVIILNESKLQISEIQTTKKDVSKQVLQKSNSEIEKLSLDEEPKNIEPKKKKKVEIFSIISVVFTVASVLLYFVMPIGLVIPIVIMALLASIVTLTRFKNDKNKYFKFFKYLAIIGITLALIALVFFFLNPDSFDFESKLGWIIIE